MMQEKTYSIRGVSPLRMSSVRGGDRTDPIVKRIQELTSISEKDRTDVQVQEIADLEWEVKLYTDADGEPCIPAENIERMLVDGAAKKYPRKGVGDKIKVGVFVLEDARIVHDGGTVQQISKDPKYRITRLISVSKSNKNKVTKTRPLFPRWAAKIKLRYDDQIIDVGRLDELFIFCGQNIAILDSRPRCGRFEVE
jgi:hypothetical protein